MYQEERMNAILDYLKINKRISVEEIYTKYNVSRDTARRDLVNLEKKSLITRTHGGAILPITSKKIVNYNERLLYNSKEKKAIGKLAASLIKNNDNIIMDTSTTVQACAEYIQNKECSIVTNSINLANVLSKKPSIKTYLLGGRLNYEYGFVYGSSTINMLSNYFADKVFLGACGITENGLTIDDKEDAAVMKKMIEQSKKIIVLADHSKFYNNRFIKVADLNKIDLIITDISPTQELIKIFKENKINLIVIEK